MSRLLEALYWLAPISAAALALAVVMDLAERINGDEGLGIVITCYVVGALLFCINDPRSTNR